nr:hypothetical protein BN993_02321 [Virgibacillus halodenitrificans]
MTLRAQLTIMSHQRPVKGRASMVRKSVDKRDKENEMRQVWLMAILVGGIGASVSACSYTPARIDPEPVVEVGDGHHDHDERHEHGHGGDFCPPGQAKKGNC